MITLFTSLLLDFVCSLHSIGRAEKIFPTLGIAGKSQKNISKIYRKQLSVAAAPPPEGAVGGQCRKFVPLPAPHAARKGDGAPRRVRDSPLRSRAGRGSQISAQLPHARLQVYSGSPGKD